MKVTVWILHILKHVFRSWRSLSTNWIIRVVNMFVFVSFISSVAIILWHWRLLPPEVPLFYSRPWGQDQLVRAGWLFLLPAGSISWYIINTIIATFITNEYLIFTQTLYITSFIISLLSFITLIKILFLVS